MFHKPFRVKTQTAIKGSDRKKLRAELGRQFNLDAGLLTEIVPNKEEMTVMKIFLHSGGTVVVYNISGNPAFFEVNKIWYPTVYSLWKHPEFLRVFTTWPPVFKKITGGADLMLPGVIVKGPVTLTTFGKLRKGDACSVKLLGNKAPVAVGIAALSGSDMYESAMRGKGVVVYHSYTDHLWAFGDKSHPPNIDDPEMLEAVKANDEDLSESDDSEEVEAAEGNGEESQTEKSADSDTEVDYGKDNDATEDNHTDDAASDIEDLKLSDITGDDTAVAGVEHEEEMADEDPRTLQERMDELLSWCCLCAVKSRVKKSDLPLLTSTFFRNFMQPCCPSDKTADVKKSSYKKLSKFLKSMQDRGFLRVKELSKGVESIVEITKDHPELREFMVPGPSNQEEAKPAATVAASSEFVPPEIAEVFLVNAAVTGFFKAFGYRKGSDLSAVDVRQCLTEYIKENELKADQKGVVTLDAILSDLVLSKGDYTEQLRWENLMSRTMNKMSPACKITLQGQPPIIKKGKLEPISFNIAQRGGNKKVTLIHGLEVYGLDPQEFAHRVQIGMACSASVSDRPGKNQGKEVLVQGNQINFISSLLLEKYKIPRKYITGMEKAPKSGKKR